VLPKYYYKSFYKDQSLAVLCRGLSVKFFPKLSKGIRSIFLIGQFEKAMAGNFGKSIKNKNKVQVTNINQYLLKSSIYKIQNIKDVQTNIFKHSEEERKKYFYYMKKKYRWANVHYLPDIIPENRYITTGILGIKLASLFKPKSIKIFGLDFYTTKYFSKEKIKGNFNKSVKKRDKMIEGFLAIIKENKEIQFDLFTYYPFEFPENLDNLNIKRF
jgi:hypothetical protein